MATLFAEELGLVVQVDTANEVSERMTAHSTFSIVSASVCVSRIRLLLGVVTRAHVRSSASSSSVVLALF